jgi:glycosyltransferase involved in cell wall biosynthesis
MVMTVLAPIGGIEAALVPLSLALQAQGHEVIVFAVEPIAWPNQNAEALRRAGIVLLTSPGWLVRLARLGVAWRTRLLRVLTAGAAPFLLPLAAVDALRRRRSLRRSLQGALGRWHGALARRMNYETLYYQALGRAFRRRPPDVVHVHGWGCGEDPPGLMEWLQPARCPVVYTEHNSPDLALVAEIETAPMNLAEVLIAVSRAGEAGLRQVGHATRPIVVIPYSVDPLPEPAPRPARRDGFAVACVARLMPQKGHVYLLEAMARVTRQVPGSRLLLAGEGPLRGELEIQARQLGLNELVSFLGIVPRAQLPELLAQTDVVVLASRWEGLPVALIEVMSAGKPIVASNVGGNPELVVDGENGLVVPPADPGALAEALLRLAHDAPLRERLGHASRRRFEQGGFSPPEVAARTLEAYHLAAECAHGR